MTPAAARRPPLRNLRWAARADRLDYPDDAESVRRLRSPAHNIRVTTFRSSDPSAAETWLYAMLGYDRERYETEGNHFLDTCFTDPLNGPGEWAIGPALYRTAFQLLEDTAFAARHEPLALRGFDRMWARLVTLTVEDRPELFCFLSDALCARTDLLCTLEEHAAGWCERIACKLDRAAAREQRFAEDAADDDEHTAVRRHQRMRDSLRTLARELRNAVS